MTLFTRKALTVLLLLVPAGMATAQDEDPAPAWWQLDVVVFERVQAPPHSYDESWGFAPPAWPAGMLDPAWLAANDSRRLGARLFVLGDANSSLREAASTLERRSGFALLATQSLRFPQNIATPPIRLDDRRPLRLVARDTRADSDSPMAYWLSAPDLAPPVDIHRLQGWVELDHDIHPIVELELSLLVPLSGIAPQQVDPDGRAEYYRDQVHQYWLRGQRRLRPGQIAYFDHPRLGVLARLTAVPGQLRDTEPEVSDAR